MKKLSTETIIVIVVVIIIIYLALAKMTGMFPFNEEYFYRGLGSIPLEDPEQYDI
jgi:hypothetical protein